MKRQVLLSLLVAAGSAVAPGAFAESSMDKPGMAKPATDKMEKPGGTMAKPASDADKMKKPTGMMDDKKDSMSAPMKKN